MTNEEIMKDPDIELVVNLTTPLFHFDITKAALLAGKHVYSEKMMAITMAEGRKLLDAGLIGEPLNAVAMVIRGYHVMSDKDDGRLPFVFGPGAGNPFDVGSYYLHAPTAAAPSWACTPSKWCTASSTTAPRISSTL